MVSSKINTTLNLFLLNLATKRRHAVNNKNKNNKKITSQCGVVLSSFTTIQSHKTGFYFVDVAKQSLLIPTIIKVSL